MIRCRIEGMEDLVRRLEQLQDKVRQKGTKKAVRAGSKVIVKLAKARLTVDRRERGVRDRNKLLRKALGSVIGVYKGGRLVLAAIGARTGFKTQVGVRTRDGKKSKKGDPIYEDPSKIAHLVEQGHGGPHPAPPHPFLRPAVDEGAGLAYDAMAQAIRDTIESN